MTTLLTLLLSAILCFGVGCKNSNSTTTELSERRLPFDNNAYLSIPHAQGESALRRKLLNMALSDKLKTNQVTDESQKIKKGDVFRFKDETFKLSTTELAEYQNFKENSAEVIVSYSDHLVIYFVPTGIAYEKALQQLGLALRADENVVWAEAPDSYLTKEKTYYLLSATNSEMKENDVHYNQVVTKIGSDFNEKYFNFASNQLLELKVKADYFVKETSYIVLSGSKIPCKGSDWETGVCGPCQYKMEAPSGGYKKIPLETSELIDLDIIVNGRGYRLVELGPLKDKEGNFIVTLDLKKMLTTNLGTIEFRKNVQYPVVKQVRGIDYAANCSNKNIGNTIDVTPSLKIDLEMKVKGRLLNF